MLLGAKLALALTLFAGVPPNAAAQAGTRSLSGMVTDKRGNPLPGAVVLAEDTSDFAVRSYITGRDGHYYFNDLFGNADYTIACKYRKWTSGTKTLSKFNGKPHPEMDLRIPID